MKRHHKYIISMLLCTVVWLSLVCTAGAQQLTLARGVAEEEQQTSDLGLQAVPTPTVYTL